MKNLRLGNGFVAERTALFKRSLPFFACANCAPVGSDGVAFLLSGGLGRWGTTRLSAGDPRSPPETDLDPAPLFITVTKPTAGRSEQDHEQVRRQCVLASIVGFLAPLIAAYIFAKI